MRNPWLDIPLLDYEGHMNSANVAQLTPLADLFEEALRFCRPESVAILGIAGGNGLDRIDLRLTKRIVGIDIHAAYLNSIRSRYPQLPLTLRCLDLEQESLEEDPVALVHAALIFEHAGIGQCLQNAAALVASGGHLAVVLQLPSETQADVSPTPFKSMLSLAAQFKLVDQTKLQQALDRMNFRLRHQTRRDLPAGKAFWLGIFAKQEKVTPSRTS
jgi:predicted TPR repeat methyltransferase